MNLKVIGIMDYQSFKDWYFQTGGCSILVDFDGKALQVLDSEEQVVTELILSVSIDSKFNLVDLFIESHKIGDYLYMVLIDGYEGKHYLWKRRIELKL